MRLVYEPLTDIPKGFTEVEYLESTGTQYIDTGVKTTNKTKAIVKSVGMTWVFGGRTSLSYGDAFGVCMGQNAAYLQFGNQSITYSKTNIKNDIVLLENSQDGCYVNGVKQATYNTQTFTGTNNIYLFNLNDNDSLNDGLIGKIWFSKIYEDGVLVRDFVPCLDNNNVPCMYDKVEGKAYYNQGTGSFIYGRKIIPVEYLESTGTQYIDTGYKFTSNMRFKINHIPTGSISDNYFTGHYATDNKVFLGGFYQNKCIWGIGKLQENTINASANQRFVVDMTYTSNSSTNTSSVSGTINGQSVSLTSTALQNFIYGLNILAFARNNNGSVGHYLSCKLYSFQIYNSDTLVRDFIPIRDENNVGYMFDKVSHTLYANSGTGAFLYKDYEEPIELINNPKYIQVEYLQSTGTQYIDTGWSPVSNDLRVNFRTKSMSSPYANAICGAENRDVVPKWVFIMYGQSADATKTYPLTGNWNNNDKGFTFTSGSVLEIDWTTSSTSTTITDNVSGTTYTYDFGSTINYSNNPITLKLFQNGDNQKSSVQINYYKIWDNGTLVRNFIPAIRKSDNKPGMYDKVSGNFYTNSGTGEFLYGSFVGPLPKEYEELDYLEATGTQYIDTGVIPNEAVSYSWEIYAQAVDTSVNDYHWFIGTQTPWAMAGTYPDRSSSYTFYPGGGDYYQDGVKVSTPSGGNKYAFVKHIISYTGSSSNSTSITLFARRSSNGGVSAAGSKKIFGCKISKNNVLIRDYIPVMGWDGKGYMYDKVSGQLFGNAGTGTFVKGEKAKVLRNKICRLVGGTGVRYVDGYRMIDYLESSGTEYINTGLAPNANQKIELRGFKAGGGSTSGGYIACGSTATANDRIQIWAEGGGLAWFRVDGASIQTNESCTVNRKFVLDIKNKKGYVDSSEYNLSYSGSLTTYPYFLFLRNNGGTPDTTYNAPMRLYYVKIWDNDSLVRDFVPVLDENNVPCMYDKVTKALFKNQGSGNFTYGNILEGNINRIIYSGI